MPNPLHWASTLQLLELVAVGAILLLGLFWSAGRPTARPWLMPLLTMLGLLILAAAFDVLKNRVHGGIPEWKNPAFKAVRNVQSLTLALVPLAFAAFHWPRLRRVAAAVLGATGLALLILPGWAAIQHWNQVFSAQAAVLSIPGASLLAHDGNLAMGRWVGCLGAALLAVPTVRWLIRTRGGASASQPDGMGWTLLGLGITSLAMAVFFWHQGDDRHRYYCYLIMQLTAFGAPLLALATGRVATARWAQHGLGLCGGVIALWLLTGVAGGNFGNGFQEFADLWVTMILLFLLMLIPPVLAMHLTIRAIRRGWIRRRQNAQCSSPDPEPS